MMSRAAGRGDHLRSGARVGSWNQARLFGVLGDPVDHSLSPVMHNTAFGAAGLPHVYLRYRVSVEALPDAVREAKALRMGGLNLTVPLKEAVLPLLDGLTPTAEAIGAVNTIVFSARGRALGDNTDGEGFLRALRGRVRLEGARAVVIGAGGSARAVGTALSRAGCASLAIANRTLSRGEQLAEQLRRPGVATSAVPLAALARGDAFEGAALVVNATPLGLAGARLLVRYAAAPRDCVFVDLVYGSRPTPFLAGAARAGRPTLDGSPMLLHQGALAFEAWTGRRAPRAAMTRALRAAGLPLTEPAAAASVPTPRPPTR
jgi:shikimate dehydrogenase